MFSNNNKTRRRVGPEPDKGEVAVSKNNNTRKKLTLADMKEKKEKLDMKEKKEKLPMQMMKNATVVPGTKEQEEQGKEDPFGFLDNQTVDSQAQQQGQYKSPKVIPLNDGDSVTNPLLDTEDREIETIDLKPEKSSTLPKNTITKSAFVKQAEPSSRSISSSDSSVESQSETIEQGNNPDEEEIKSIEDFEDFKNYLTDLERNIKGQFKPLYEANKNKEKIKNMNEEELEELEGILKNSQDKLEELKAKHKEEIEKINKKLEELELTEDQKEEVKKKEKFLLVHDKTVKLKIETLKEKVNEQKNSLTIEQGSNPDEEEFKNIEEIKKYLEDSRQSMGNQFPLLSEAYKNKENIKNMNKEELLELEGILKKSQDELEKLEAEHEKIKNKNK